MLLVRPYSEEDFEQVKALHKKQGLDYELPDLKAPGMLVRGVMEENGQITEALFLRKTAEAYWLFDSAESKRNRLARLQIFHKEMTPAALRCGFEDVHCWIPPEVSGQKLFDRTMLRLGWERPEWTCYSRRLE